MRIGPKRNKNKQPSGPALHKFYAIDIINSSSTLKYVEDYFEIPEMPKVTNVNTSHKHVCPMLVIHASIPMEELGMLNSPINGPCFVIFYFVIS